MIKRIKHIKGIGVFQNYLPEPTLPDFTRYNTIYAFNGSGKTTLSRIFSQLSSGTPPEGAESTYSYSFQRSDNSILSPQNALSHPYNIKVFNQNFIWDNIQWSKLGAKGVIFLGEEQEELSTTLKESQNQRSKINTQIDDGTAEKDKLERERNSPLTREAKRIKNEPWCRGHYDKSQLEKAIIEVKNHPEKFTLDSTALNVKQKEASPSETKKILEDIDIPDKETFLKILNSAAELTQRKIPLSDRIKQLDEDQELSEWVETGKNLHEHKTHCSFCEGTYHQERKDKLTEHYSPQQDKLKEDIKNLLSDINTFRKDLPEEIRKDSVFSEYWDQDLVDQYLLKREELLSQEVNPTIEDSPSIPLSQLEVDLRKRHDNPATPFSLEIDIQQLEKDIDAIIASMNGINGIIEKHNGKVEKSTEIKEAAETTLKNHYAAMQVTAYLKKCKDIGHKEKELTQLKEKQSELNTKIGDLKDKISSYGPAVTTINQDLERYLGHSEIKLKLNAAGNGYNIQRNGKISNSPLSEGEKTALAFCYFISTLKENGNDINDTVVVIDDPISSLDSRYLYYAFQFMKSSVENAKQVFILTHNYGFFRECRYWMNRKNENQHKKNRSRKEAGKDPKPMPCSFYELKTTHTSSSGIRQSSLNTISRLLLDYESEYQYLFQKVLEAQKNGNIDDIYNLAHALRKIMETFLHFKVPDKSSNTDKLNKIVSEYKLGITKAQSSSISKFLNDESHADSIEKSSSLSEPSFFTLDTIDQALKIIMDSDPLHYAAMTKETGK